MFQSSSALGRPKEHFRGNDRVPLRAMGDVDTLPRNALLKNIDEVLLGPQLFTVESNDRIAHLQPCHVSRSIGLQRNDARPSNGIGKVDPSERAVLGGVALDGRGSDG